MERIDVAQSIKKIGQEVKLAGWVNVRRDHGKIIFIDIRDRSGIIQVVFTPQNKELYNKANELRQEWIVELIGKVNKRPEKMVNPNIPTGEVEIEALSMCILSKAKPLPIPINTDGKEINEDTRLKYRYLDIRRERIKNNLITRHRLELFIRNYLSERGFLEIETPILTKSTPEGARDFLVPSRIHKGKFYALPQSPQQYKQLLMVAGIEKYFQIARCFRDEDTRADRGLEFSQLDIEMSFVDTEDILTLTENLVIECTEKIIGKEIINKPFPRISYREAVEKYKTDSPDLRQNKKDANEMAYVWVIDFPMFEKLDDGSITTSHHPFTAILDEDIPLLSEKEKLYKIRAKQYDLVLNGYEIFGGSVRTTDPQILEKVFKALGYEEKKIKEDFGHLLEAFEYGVPPHGGIAGFDRWVQAMLGEESIREVIPFPTTGKGTTSVMDAPISVSEKQLKELGIKLIKQED